MKTTDLSLYQMELEEITGKVFTGDFTPLVYDMLKNSKAKDILIRELGGTPPKKEAPKTTKAETSFVSFEKLFNNGLEVR